MSSSEVAELRELFASPPQTGSPPRESALPLTRIAKFGVADENRRLAEQGRMEKEARLAQREQEAAERLAKAHASKAAAQLSHERAREHKEMTRQMNQSLVRAIRETEQEWEQEKQMAFANFQNEGRKRVLIANALDARLDAQEAAVDAEERRIATLGRTELLNQIEDNRAQMLQSKRRTANNVRDETTKRVAEAQDAAAAQKKMTAQVKRAESAAHSRQKRANDAEQQERAMIGKQAADLTKTNLRKSNELMKTERLAAVMRDKKERMIDYTVAQDKSKQMAANREQVEKRYRSKFANASDSAAWETAPLRRWYG